MPTKFHLGWFSQIAGPVGWNGPTASPDANWLEPEMYQRMAQICEKGKFDLALIADHHGISSDYGDSMDSYLQHGLTVCHDSTILATMIAAKTERLGVGTTIATTFTPPYHLARQLASLDYLSKQRIAWNIVTSYNKSGFLNFGLDDVIPHDMRYDIADEYMELCSRLWGSWEPDAVVMDREADRFADSDKVKPIRYEGSRYRSMGPLNMVPPRGGRPVTIQAGSSDRGMEFASRWADAVIVSKQTIADLKKYRDDVKARAEKYGRKPEDVKVLFIIKPVIGDTEAQAKEKAAQPVSEGELQRALSMLSSRMGFDLSKLELDAPVPSLNEKKIDGGQTTLSRHQTTSDRPTLRTICEREATGNNLDITGTPEQVADRMQHIIESVGGDGFVLRVNAHEHAYMQEFVDRVVPILQERGAMRASYAGSSLREHLMEF